MAWLIEGAPTYEVFAAQFVDVFANEVRECVVKRIWVTVFRKLQLIRPHRKHGAIPLYQSLVCLDRLGWIVMHERVSPNGWSGDVHRALRHPPSLSPLSLNPLWHVCSPVG
jgi:hypothetical protein